jgi:aminopeptidase
VVALLRSVEEDQGVSRDLTRRLAELAVCVGANVQAGQDVVVLAWDVEQAPLVREVADRAYRRGARFVSALYWDAHVKRSRLLHAPTKTLEFVPDWWDAITNEGVARRSAVIHLHTPTRAELLEDIPLERAMRDVMPVTQTFWDAVDRGDLVWSVVPGVWRGLARAILGTADVEALWQVLAPILRLDTPDPQAAWRDHFARLRDRAALLQERNFAALRFRGGGTDLTVGLLAGAKWVTVAAESKWGQTYVSNLPSEEVFTTPDYRRTEGVVRATRPLQLGRSGSVDGLRMRFEQGRVVDLQATHGANRLRAELAVDPGAARLGEVALVDGSSVVGRSGLVFNYGLLDENATCHIALGSAYPHTMPDLPNDPDAQAALGFNRSACHDDVMIGGPEVDVLGIDENGDEVPVIVEDRWLLT